MSKKYSNWITLGILAIVIFLFFFFMMPYHLFHREQISLFLFAKEPIMEYFAHPAYLANLLGDFLTQFFYYIGVGSLIISLLLTILLFSTYKLAEPYIGKWSWIPAIVITIYEAFKECDLFYHLSGTIALTGIIITLIICRICIKHYQRIGIALSVFIIGVGYWMFGYGSWKTHIISNQDFRIEKMLAVDAEYYFGNYDKCMAILDDKDLKGPFFSYYYNLINAKEGLLPYKIMDIYQPGSNGLFIPVDKRANYFTITAANEVWFALGDMTMAEHAAILGMIFSPSHTGSRTIKRLAEINLINNDKEAAKKYLRILSKTFCYRKWADERMPGKQTQDIKNWIQQKRQLLARTDTLRASNDVAVSLQHILNDNPDNYIARDYLLSYDLLNKDIKDFANDYKEYCKDRMPEGVFAQAALIYIAGSKSPNKEIKKWSIPPTTTYDFENYTKLYEANNGDGTFLQPQYGKTYWFYFHYAVLKQ